MHTAALKKIELIHKISKLTEQKIHEVDNYIKKILLQLKIEKPKPVSLKGIWKNKGFEKLTDLETEIKLIRVC